MNEIIFYQNAEHQPAIEVQFDGDTVWLTQSQMATLFQRERTIISKRIHNIFNEKELDEKSNVQKRHFANYFKEGK